MMICIEFMKLVDMTAIVIFIPQKSPTTSSRAPSIYISSMLFTCLAAKSAFLYFHLSLL